MGGGEGGVVESAEMSVLAEPGRGEHRHRYESGRGRLDEPVALVVGQDGPPACGSRPVSAARGGDVAFVVTLRSRRA